MAYIPNRGDIIHLSFDPSTGCEIKGERYALVISPRDFNRCGLAWIFPITQGNAGMARNRGFLVTLIGTGTATQGAVNCQEIKALDWRSRKAQFRETVPDYVMDEVTGRILPIINP